MIETLNHVYDQLLEHRQRNTHRPSGNTSKEVLHRRTQEILRHGG